VEGEEKQGSRCDYGGDQSGEAGDWATSTTEGEKNARIQNLARGRRRGPIKERYPGRMKKKRGERAPCLDGTLLSKERISQLRKNLEEELKEAAITARE